MSWKFNGASQIKPYRNTASMIGWWNLSQETFNGTNYANWVPGGNPGTPSGTGALTGTTDRHGIANRALDFPGNPSTTNLRCGRTTALEGVAHFTITLWMQPDTVAGTRYIFAYFLSGGAIIVLTTSGNGIFQWIENGANAGQGTKTGLLSVGQWYHFAWVFDGTLTGNDNRSKLYRNGSLITGVSWTGTVPATTYPDFTGREVRWGYENTSTFDGKMADARIYSSSLSADQVADIAGFYRNLVKSA